MGATSSSEEKSRKTDLFKEEVFSFLRYKKGRVA